MLVLWDKGFDSNAFLTQVSATGAQVLGRLRSNRRTPVLATLTDGSYLSVSGTLRIRIIEARVTVTCTDGTTFTGTYALRPTMQGRILRSGDPAGLEQQMWSVLTLYQPLRTVMVDAAESRPGTDPGPTPTPRQDYQTWDAR
ncbi:hypothetical protein [Nonomuraea sp. KM90]|uniref:hypothetical protein n=1 Tax=Nonomuraea sp. KM90 TaxID=3457428 RepID=UPI003FCDB1CB